MKKIIIAILSSIMILSLALFFGGCANGKIATPTDIAFDEDNNMTWSEVENARSYVVEITNYLTGVKTEQSSRLNTFSLSVLQEGDYNIRIKALPTTRKLEESDWSKTIYFYKKYETGCVYTLINSDKEYEISRVGNATGSFTIEDEYRSKPVTKIADAAFRRSRDITEVVVGKNVISIGDSAFSSCPSLIKVVLPDGLTYLGDSCFLSCSLLEEVNIPARLEQILPHTFQYCRSLKKAVFPDGLESIGEQAFYGCIALKEIIIPDSVTALGEQSFTGCTTLSKVVIGNGVTEIPLKCFENCSLKEGVVFGDEGNLEILGMNAFAGCTDLAGMNIPEGVTEIGTNCFLNCPKFTFITIPETCVEVGSYINYKTPMFSESDSATGKKVFYADGWLVGVSADLIDSLVYIGYKDYALATPENNIEIEDGTVGISASVFAQAPLLERVRIPVSMKYICNSAFSNCANLWQFEAYDSELSIIGSSAFYKCERLANLRLGQKLREIGHYAFYKCTSLHMPEDEMNIGHIVPDSVRRIGGYAFFNSGIWEDSAADTENGGVVYVGNWAVGKTVNTGSITLKAGTIGISDYAFYEPQNLQEEGINAVRGTSDLKYIGAAAFYCCKSLGYFELSSNITEINDFTFAGCLSLTTVSVPMMLERIGRSAFYLTGLESIDLSDCFFLSEIDYMAFAYNYDLREIILPLDTLSTINTATFYQCTSLESITIPDGISEIQDQAFLGCYALKSVTFEQTENSKNPITEIGKGAFYQCYNLETINLPDTVEIIEDSAFFGCSNLQKVETGDKLWYIGDNAFGGDLSLKNINITSNVQYIGAYAFSGCENLASVTIPDSVTYIGPYAFYQCTFATIYTDCITAYEEWHPRINASYRPVIWGATLSQDGTYVVSITVSDHTFDNDNEYNAVTAPSRDGYVFKGWALSQDGTPEYGASQLNLVAKGTTVYAVWEAAPVADTEQDGSEDSGAAGDSDTTQTPDSSEDSAQ